jgi:hypothetical protein
MYITLTDVQSDVPVKLYTPIDNTRGDKRVCLREMFYTFSWTNISTVQNNNWIRYIIKSAKSNKTEIIIPDGYYDFCTLDKIIFKPYKIDAKLNPANLIVTLTFPTDASLTIESLTMSQGLAKMLGFDDSDDVTKLQWEKKAISTPVFQAPNPINMSVNQRFYIYLSELKSTDNVLNGVPSYLLRIIPSEEVTYCKPTVVRFLDQQPKLLNDGIHRSLCLTIKNQNNEIIHFHDLTIILTIQ